MFATPFVIMQHIDAFFGFVHPVSYHAFLHRATFIQTMATSGCVQNSEHMMLLLAVCANASPWVSRSDAAANQAAEWARQSRHLLMDLLHKPTMNMVATCLLLVLVASSRGERAIVWTMSAMAGRLAYGLQLHLEDDGSNLPEEVKEMRRRLMWAVYCLDKLAGRGNTLIQNIASSSLRIRLPCSSCNYAVKVSCIGRRSVALLRRRYY